ncbi:MAG: tetraacyldisaccharide 4'-kinase [Betaproteobacteria bacterium RIFCSPLOWO2_02_FULL_67_26]|nr:MAG: tetraacyldisaccharide 4'-kinase [Betaproteobacteria bacterium RIFCSPLOWO2_02_FULL_67_26]
MAWIERHWQSVTPVSALLYPVSLLYGAVAAARRAASAPVRLPVPVIVIGNITAGGTGKTPLVLWLAEWLRARGRAPGIVCRGHGGSLRAPRRVLPGSDPLANGDEAVLLARRSGCEVWSGADRAATARALLESRRDCDVVLSDDGLQHYGLARDFEICVVDGARGFGNAWLLPAGPLRERPPRLAAVDAVVIHSGAAGALHPTLDRIPGAAARYSMTVEGREFRNLLNPAHAVGADYFHGRRVHAMAGIGDPRRFFRHLEGLGLEFTAHPFPDHHAYRAAELAFPGADAVLMTEKDAVKCQPCADERHWALRVDAQVDPALGERVLRKLNRGD